jgi:hypothetical protein
MRKRVNAAVKREAEEEWADKRSPSYRSKGPGGRNGLKIFRSSC